MALVKFTLELPKELNDDIASLADKKDRSKNAQIRVAIRQHLIAERDEELLGRVKKQA